MQTIKILPLSQPGNYYSKPILTDFFSADYVKRLSASVESPLDTLTDRQRQILQLIAEGKNTKQIALRLHGSPKTIDANRRQIMAKLGAHSIAELVKFAIVGGLASLDN